ncbi:MAG: hypothetical protein HKN24_08315 [Acidimicrobiales bacterium]|nr:hypothetical protein [Acidimicrobiales bacterium]
MALDLNSVEFGTPPPLPAGAELLAVTDALTTNHRGSIEAERRALVEALGPSAAERAIGVCATFQMMNRALDGVGAPVAASLRPLAADLGFDPNSIPR